MMLDCIIIGGGAAGFFAAVTLKRVHPEARAILLERTNSLLTKVRISGGGRCNVTHHLFDPKELVQRYPRGSKELLGAFHRFQPRDTIEWFRARGVPLVTEADGRMFPSTHSSETIAEALLREADRVGLPVRRQVRVERIAYSNKTFVVHIEGGEQLSSSKLIVATGSSSQGHEWAAALGHTIVPPVPSLFTFNVPSSPLKDLSGVSVSGVRVSLEGSALREEGPLLITHFGFSGPAVLRLSAYGACWLHAKNYRATLCINWLGGADQDQIFTELNSAKKHMPKKAVATQPLFGLPASLWRKLVPCDLRWHDASAATLRQLATRICNDKYLVEGKTTHKEEFVTAGGVSCKEVNFKTMESKVCPGLFFAGEVLDVDGITGGFNFQNAWTTGFLAAHGALGIAPERA